MPVSTSRIRMLPPGLRLALLGRWMLVSAIVVALAILVSVTSRTDVLTGRAWLEAAALIGQARPDPRTASVAA